MTRIVVCLLAGLGLAALSSLIGAPAPPGPKKKFTNSIGMQFVLIPSGTFTMGSPKEESGREANEGPRHEVQITRSFYLAIFEVTQGEYEKIMGKNPSGFSPKGHGKDRIAGVDAKKLPVETVDWHDAVKFCEELTAWPKEKGTRRLYRLPTEAEWEYACRAGAKEHVPFSFGKSIGPAQANLNTAYGAAGAGKPVTRTSEVGSYKPNAWGLYDMHGNVWEWTGDWIDDYSKRKVKTLDPKGAATGSQRVFRGGCWTNPGYYCRTAKRYPATPNSKNDLIGFRVACVPGGAK
jgi:formylglycine-generating enzyme required for sulfatase activity